MAEKAPDTHVNAPPGDGAQAANVEHVGAPEHHPEPTALGLDAPQWIALAMVVVFAILIWKRVPALIAAALDRKITTIKAQLDEAAQLRSEAEAIRAEYEAKAAQAGAEAEAMIARAQAEAEGILRQADADAAALVERRTRMAEEKIAAAERAALQEVRVKTADAAAAAAERLMREKVDAATDRALVDQTIGSLAER
ncbi:MAG TPA: F0F1 ATP synthase subunit B [Allosphingosinicella sp.]|nr:F0F1 ATP synthase subunit B [Allosphingosinicella sp.]